LTRWLRALALIAAGAAVMALAQTLGAQPHMLPHRPLVKMTLAQQEAYWKRSAWHGMSAVAWAREHRPAFAPASKSRGTAGADVVIRNHRWLWHESVARMHAVQDAEFGTREHPGSPATRRRISFEIVASFSRRIPSAERNSVTTTSAPNRRHNRRNGDSDTPAIGAR